MDPAQLTATQVADRLLRFCNRMKDRCDTRTWDAVREACRRVRQHEILTSDVLPDLRNRLTAAEESACTGPAGAASSPA